MKRLITAASIFAGFISPVFSQSVVEMNLAERQNPVFEVSTNEVALVLPGEAGVTIGADLVITGGSGEYSYRWYNSKGDELGDNETLEISEPGDYLVDISDTCDCVQTVSFNVSPAGIEDVVVENQRITPNPTTGVINFNGIDAVQLTGVDLSGRLVLLVDLNGDVFHQADLGNLNEGLYFITITTSNKKTFTEKIIKK